MWGAIGAYITYRYLINKHKKVIEYLELRSQKSLAAEIEEKEDTIEKYKNKDIAREIEHDNLKKELRQIIELNRIKVKKSSVKPLILLLILRTYFVSNINQQRRKYRRFSMIPIAISVRLSLLL